MKTFKKFNEGYASNHPAVKKIKIKFKKEIKKAQKSGNYIEQGDPLFDALEEYLSNQSGSGSWNDDNYAWEEVNDFLFDFSKFGLGKV